MVFYQEIVISDSFRRLFQRQRYEECVYTIIRNSTEVFKDRRFERVMVQANGQCDFVDEEGNKYDVKVLFNSKQGALIGERKNEIIEWVETMTEERAQFCDCIRNRDMSLVKNTELYKITKARLLTVEYDENAIFFIPFPIVIDSRNWFFSRFASDFLQAIYEQLDEEKLIKDRELYYIYPSIEQDYYVLRNGSNGRREYLEVPELRNVIQFRTADK